MSRNKLISIILSLIVLAASGFFLFMMWFRFFSLEVFISTAVGLPFIAFLETMFRFVYSKAREKHGKELKPKFFMQSFLIVAFIVIAVYVFNSLDPRIFFSFGSASVVGGSIVWFLRVWKRSDQDQNNKENAISSEISKD